MITLKNDFGFVGRLFGVPREWLSRVGAFCTSWVVEGTLLKLKVPEFPDPIKNPITISVDEDSVQDFVDEAIRNSGSEDPSATEIPGPAAGDTGYISTADSSEWPSGAGGSAIDLRDNTTWVRGVNQSNGSLSGVKIPVITGIARFNVNDYLLIRTLEFDSNGMLKSVTAELGAFKNRATLS